jgi:hypothetical protein
MAWRAETLGVHGTDAASAGGDNIHNSATNHARASAAPAQLDLIHPPR